MSYQTPCNYQRIVESVKEATKKGQLYALVLTPPEEHLDPLVWSHGILLNKDEIGGEIVGTIGIHFPSISPNPCRDCPECDSQLVPEKNLIHYAEREFKQGLMEIAKATGVNEAREHLRKMLDWCDEFEQRKKVSK